mgnify:CR=1 FL=1
MRRKQQQEYVRPITTGHVEADMLGQVYLWVSERTNRLNAQRFHRKTYKKRQPKSIFRVVIECIRTAPTACLRSLKAWQDKKDASVPKYLHGLRKDKRNGN